MAMLSTFGRHPWPMMGLALASGRVGQREIAAAVYDGSLLALFWPGFDPVRKEPEFAQILRGMGWDRPFDAAIEGPSRAAKTEGARPSVPGASRM